MTGSVTARSFWLLLDEEAFGVGGMGLSSYLLRFVGRPGCLGPTGPVFTILDCSED